MKKLLFIALLFSFFTSKIEAQTKSLMVDTGKMWIYLKYSNPMYQKPPISINYKKTTFYKFTSDTVINNKTYKKLLESDDSATTWTCSRFMREDENSIVFYLNKDSITERPIYQFKLSNSDVTINGHYILKTDSVDFKRYLVAYSKTDTDNYDIWLENIGSTRYLFYEPFNACFCPGALYYNELLCYFEHDTLKYHNPDFTACYYNIGTSIKTLQLAKMIVSPNPVKNVLSIKIETPFKNNNVFVENNQGHKILLKTFEGNEMQLDVKLLPAGIYYVNIENQGRLIAQSQFVKQ